MIRDFLHTMAHAMITFVKCFLEFFCYQKCESRVDSEALAEMYI